MRDLADAYEIIVLPITAKIVQFRRKSEKFFLFEN